MARAARVPSGRLPSGRAEACEPATANRIVPAENVAARSFAAVIAIMTFLACLSVGAAAIVARAAGAWQGDISREFTVQIKPFDKADMELSVREAGRLLAQFPEIERVTALDAGDAARLLEPWLGAGANLKDLPVPRLLAVTVKRDARPDFDAIRAALGRSVKGASIDDHHAWRDDLGRAASALIAAALAVLGLVLGATALIVAFATRGAMAGSRDVIDVLHFAGAEPGRIAGFYQRHFFAAALRGAAGGGLLAAALTAALRVASGGATALAGPLTPGVTGYGAMAAIAALVALLAALASRFVALRHLRGLEVYGDEA
jgi:cell division transport system permease protein